MANNPIIVKCSSCSSNVEYDIKEHSYRCKACGQETTNADAVTRLANWRKEQQSKIKEELHGLPQTVVSCPNCGAELFFKEDEATANCPYCDTPMIRKEYDKIASFPESIIPFKITLDEAKKRLQDYLAQTGNKFKEEAEIAQNNINKMQGYYLPYCLIRGPLDFNINRPLTSRQFHCEVFVEKNFISGSKELDNLVLDAMEPYDWKEIVPFNFGYISGQSVKIRNIDENELTKRAAEEVAVQVRDQIIEKMDSEAIEIMPDTANILSAPVLLPVYYFKVGDFTVAVNGQTGRVSMTNKHPTKKIVNYSGWIALAAFTALGVVLFSALGLFDDPKINTTTLLLLFSVYFFSTPVGLIVLLLPKRIKTIIEKFPHASEKCLSIRKPDKTMAYKLENISLYDEKTNSSFWQEEVPEPWFWEKEGSEKFSLEFNLYKGSTLLKQAFSLMFLPFTLSLFVLICISFYYSSLELFKHIFLSIALMNVWWVLGFASTYFLAALIYHLIKYDSKIEKIPVNKCCHFSSFFPYIFYLAITVCLPFCLVLMLVTFGGTAHFFEEQAKAVQKTEEKEARLAKLHEIEKNLPALKQDKTIFKNMQTKDNILFTYNQEQHRYFINLFDINKFSSYLFSVTTNEDERIYCYNKVGSKEKSQELYKVNVNQDSFVITNINTNDRWKVNYKNNKVVIQKGQPSEEKTIYILEDETKNGMYYLTDSNLKYIGNTRLDKDNNLLVFTKDDTDPKNFKIAYFSVNSQPGKNGNKLIGSPAILTIDEFPLNLRCVMILELSQME